MSQAGTILIVEDDKQIRRYIRTTLMACGYRTLEANQANTALELYTKEKPDLILLDLGLPDLNGTIVIQKIRRESKTPIIVVSARESETDKVKALDWGADDYITKPFGTDELLARIRAVLRHSSAHTAENSIIYRYGDLIVDTDKCIVCRDGKEIHLTQTEYKFLLLLCQNSGKVLTYDFLIEGVWGADRGYDAQVLRVNMANIRRKIEKDPAVPELIKTEIGVGYRMVEMTLV